ncbi:MAG: sigma-54-dependent Fis family transcriptional regulator [Desulfobulbaceae bacterium]|nr:sigma-54-dependent Fis family transcriptional regulator [Desulfobulbaceae bacterium]
MPSPTRIVIADKEPLGLPSFSSDLDLQFKCEFENVFSEQELLDSLEKQSPQILVIDLEFSIENECIALIKSLKEEHPKTFILPIIPEGQPQQIKQILELDLFYFIHKPLEPIETAIAIRRAYDTLPKEPPAPPRTQAKQLPPFHKMIGNSTSMRHLFDLITKVADDGLSTVLIRGESGTGKEMVAKAIHAQSERSESNFVPVNCAAIPDDLLESELFGYTKGAFTGATTNKPGRIQYADRGTLFLDEIGDMKSSLQAKLLRVIQEKEFEPVGALQAIPVNTRILAATHCDLEQLVSEGTFREDLYYRLSVIPLKIPPLRERIEDIPFLVDSFFEKYAEKRDRKRFSFSWEAMAAVANYDWRGNVRELENLIQHMTILYSGLEVKLTDLPEKFHNVEIPEGYTSIESNPTSEGQSQTEIGNCQAVPAVNPLTETAPWEAGQVDFNELINDFETQLIVQALRQTEGNKKEAAKLLNLKRTTLLEKIKKKSIDGLWEK